MESETLQNAINIIKSLNPVTDVRVRKEVVTNGLRFDAEIEIITSGQSTLFLAEIKPIFTRQAYEQLITSLSDCHRNLLVVSEYINPKIARDLFSKNIYFVDCQGNIFLQLGEQIHIERLGYKPERKSFRLSGRLFQASGLKLLFTLLTEPEAVNDSYRKLASKSGVSFGTVQLCMKELLAKKYMKKVAMDNFILTNRKKLFDQWVLNYAERLRPNLTLGMFMIPPSGALHFLTDTNNFFAASNQHWLLGGNAAANELIHFYHDETMIVFINQEVVNFYIKEFRLAPSPNGQLTLMNFYSKNIWYDTPETVFPIVHPLFLYSELIYQSNERASEAAMMIYKKYLEHIIREPEY